jgi:hypothetical protein
LARHEATGQYVDALKEPDSANENKQSAQNDTSDSHLLPPMVVTITADHRIPNSQNDGRVQFGIDGLAQREVRSVAESKARIAEQRTRQTF